MKLKPGKKLSPAQLVIFIVAFGIIGYVLFRSFAAVPLVASLEAEQMILPGLRWDPRGGTVFQNISPTP